MNSIEKLVEIMRQQGAHDNPETIQIATMKTDTDISFRGNTLDTSDYLKASGLHLEAGDRIALFYCESINRFIVLCKVVKP